MTAIGMAPIQMPRVLHQGMTKPVPLPFATQIAPKMHADSVCWSCGARSLVPRYGPKYPERFPGAVLENSGQMSSNVFHAPARWLRMAATGSRALAIDDVRRGEHVFLEIVAPADTVDHSEQGIFR